MRTPRNEPSLDLVASRSLQDEENVKRIRLSGLLQLGASKNGKDYLISNANSTTGFTAAAWLTNLPTSQNTFTLSSSDADDNGAGTGARSVRVLGLNPSLEFQEEVVLLSGTSTVTTANNYLRLISAEVEETGSTNYNEGEIYIAGTAKTGHKVIIKSTTPANELPPGRSFSSHFSVPAGYNAYIDDLQVTHASVSGTAAPDISSPLIIKVFAIRQDTTGGGTEYPTKQLETFTVNADQELNTFGRNTNMKIEPGSDVIITAQYANANYTATVPICLNATVSLVPTGVTAKGTSNRSLQG